MLKSSRYWKYVHILGMCELVAYLNLVDEARYLDYFSCVNDEEEHNKDHCSTISPKWPDDGRVIQLMSRQ